jgi:hypothetical protein
MPAAAAARRPRPGSRGTRRRPPAPRARRGPASRGGAGSSWRRPRSAGRGRSNGFDSRWRARVRSQRTSSRAPTRSREASSSWLGIRTARGSPAISSPASRRASRRSVSTRSVAPRGISPGAQTMQSTPSSSFGERQPKAGRSRLIDQSRRPGKIGDEVGDPSLLSRQPLVPVLASENVEDGGPDLRNVDVKGRPGRHLHNCGGPKAASPVLTRGTYERVPTEPCRPSASTAIGSRSAPGLERTAPCESRSGTAADRSRPHTAASTAPRLSHPRRRPTVSVSRKRREEVTRRGRAGRVATGWEGAHRDKLALVASGHPSAEPQLVRQVVRCEGFQEPAQGSGPSGRRG